MAKGGIETRAVAVGRALREGWGGNAYVYFMRCGICRKMSLGIWRERSVALPVVTSNTNTLTASSVPFFFPS